jgi:hypothetical protein
MSTYRRITFGLEVRQPLLLMPYVTPWEFCVPMSTYGRITFGLEVRQRLTLMPYEKHLQSSVNNGKGKDLYGHMMSEYMNQI